MKNMIQMIKENIYAAEVAHFLAGLFILISVYVVWQTGDFTMWWAAKVAYGIGVILVVWRT